jgi:pimeloyl-ACP methyl ester carboxylesterase
MRQQSLLLLFVLFLFLSAIPASAQQGENTVVWERVPCPFDSAKAMMNVVCGRMKVPEKYELPKSRLIEIAFMIVKAKSNHNENNPILFLNGGPGQTSLYFAETLVTNALIENVVVDRDWVFMDQRGTGRSVPRLYCPDTKEQPFDLKKCRDDLVKEGIDLSQYNSERIAGDVEMLRKALGVTQWNLWGISYGSRLALAIARYYPSSVRSIVHDASGLPEGQELVDDARGVDAALNKLFSKCEADAECSSHYPQLRNRFTAAVVKLRKEPIKAGDQVFDDKKLVHFIRNWIYPRGYSTYEQRIQNLLIFMDAAARGDGQRMNDTRLLMRKEEGLDNVRPPEPVYAQQCIGQNLSVYCNERKPFETQCEYEQAVAESEIIRSFLGGFGENSECDDWPAGKADSIVSKHVYFDGPQLVFSGELDASSSGLAGYKIEMLYLNATHVVFRNGMHGQFPTELPNAEDIDYWKCALSLGNQFFSDPYQKLNTGCAETRKLRLVR